MSSFPFKAKRLFMRILFITSNRIGDAVLTTGVLSRLAQNHPGAKFTIVCGPMAAELFRAVPGLERLITLRKKRWNMHWLKLLRECSGVEWGLIADFRNSVASRLLRARKKIYGPVRSSRKHKVVENAAAFGMEPPPSPVIWTDDEAEKTALRLMPTGAPVIAIGPAANWPPKQWPIGKFVMLAQRITGAGGFMPGARILVAAAKQEREQVLPLIQSLPRWQLIETIGQDLLAVAACLRHCRMFIGNDSGLMHIASAVGIPTLGLFGPGFEKIYGPWGPASAVVRTPESAEDLLARLPKPGAHYPNLMESLSVNAVYGAAKNLSATQGSTQ